MTELRPGLDALIALNQEMAALVRAGIPLEIGLKEAAASWPKRFSVPADRVAERLSRGESLVDAIRQEGAAVSPAYVAVVEAGLASGRLSEALEDVAQLGLTVQEIRRQVFLAAVYPLLVCSLAYVLFAGFIAWCVPVWIQTRTALFLPPHWLFQMLEMLHDTIRWWGPAIPLGVFLIAICLPLFSLLRASVGAWRQIASFLWIPGVQPAFRQLRYAQFARLLAVLIEHGIPATRAMTLAADSTGDRRLEQAASFLNEQLVHGIPWDRAVRNAPGLSAYLRWMMIVGQRQGALPAVMRQAAGAYQHKAEAWLEWVRGTLPVLLAGVISGLIVALYGIGLFLPLQQFWFDLMLVK